MSVVGAFYVLCKRDGTVYDDLCKYIANPDDANFLSQGKNGEGKRDKRGRGKGGKYRGRGKGGKDRGEGEVR